MREFENLCSNHVSCPRFFQDLIVHVRDISHPETVNQKANVLNVLKNLQVPDKLMNSMVEVHNKVDLVEG